MTYSPPTAKGQSNKAGSLPVTLASDDDALTSLGTDGATPPSITGTGVRGWLRALYEKVAAANTITGDTGQSFLLTGPSRKEVTFTTTTVQAVASTDVSNYQAVSVHVVTQGTSSVVNFQGSNDNTNWVAVTLITTAGVANPATSTSTAGVIFAGPMPYRYFRLNITGISAGTTAGVVEFRSAPIMQLANGTIAAQSSTWTVQPGNTANTTAWLFTDRGATGTVSSVATSTTVATLLASNTSRKEAIIFNDSAQMLYVKLGSAATSTDFSYRLAAGGTLVEDKYTGIITGILDSSTGVARATEVA